MQSWNLHDIETPGGSRAPVVLYSDEEARAVLIGLEPGQQLGDHEVRENAFIVVVDGSARISSGDGDWVEAHAGTLVTFEPRERRTVSSERGARLLLLLAPWPGEGHYRGGDSPRASRTAR
jgi:quercetin dioxygenase-like cupin family protein